MAKQHSTAYILGFAAAVCVFFSVFVSGAAVFLKDRQELNKLLDRQEKVLVVAGLKREDEDVSPEEIGKRFDENIVARVIDLSTGDYVEDIDVASFDQRKAAKDPQTSEVAPEHPAKVARVPNNALVYHVVDRDEVAKVIIPIEGKGLWSTLYGYLALEPDTRTISGITFYEHAETPGLGGEVDNPRWRGQFDGKFAFDEQGEAQLEVIKGSVTPGEAAKYQVDGLAGATLTSRGVTNLLQFWLGEKGFGTYLQKLREG